jgi:hypothetical protein
MVEARVEGGLVSVVVGQVAAALASLVLAVMQSHLQPELLEPITAAQAELVPPTQQTQ